MAQSELACTRRYGPPGGIAQEAVSNIAHVGVIPKGLQLHAQPVDGSVAPRKEAANLVHFDNGLVGEARCSQRDNVGFNHGGRGHGELFGVVQHGAVSDAEQIVTGCPMVDLQLRNQRFVLGFAEKTFSMVSDSIMTMVESGDRNRNHLALCH